MEFHSGELHGKFNSARLLLWTKAEGAGGQDNLFNPLDPRQFL
jgi:hypothetical protein